MKFKFQCMNFGKCGNSFERQYDTQEFEKRMQTRQILCPFCGCTELNYLRSHRALKDGFVPGWQENIKEWHTCKAGYERRLKDLGIRILDKSEKILDHGELKGEQIGTGSFAAAKAVREIEEATTPGNYMPDKLLEDVFEKGNWHSGKLKVDWENQDKNLGVDNKELMDKIQGNA